MSTQGPTSFQLAVSQYHDLVAFNAYTLMQTQMAMAMKDQQIEALAQQLAQAQAKLNSADSKNEA